MSAASSQWLRGVTDLVLLAQLARGRGYGYALAESLTAAGLAPISEATVYGALRRLEGAGLCDSTLVASDSGPARRYYRLTDTGRAHLAALRAEWAGFATGVARVLDQPTETESRRSAKAVS